MPLHPNERPLTLSMFDSMAERGRRMALEALRINPDKRRDLELQFGISYMKDRYPELYNLKRRPRVYEPGNGPGTFGSDTVI